MSSQLLGFDTGCRCSNTVDDLARTGHTRQRPTSRFDRTLRPGSPRQLAISEGEPVAHLEPSPALAQIHDHAFPIAGRQVGVLAGPDADLAGIAALRTALEAEGAQLKVISPQGGVLGTGKNKQVVERTNVTARSIEFDAIIVAASAPKDGDIKTVILLHEALRQLKPFAAWADGADVLTAAGST